MMGSEEDKERSVVLRVAEAYHRDAGRWIARIDTETMRSLGLIPGDLIEIEGKSIATAIVYPAYSPDSGKSIIRIDGNIRSNAGVAIDDRVRIRQTRAKGAKQITLAPTQPIRIVSGEQYLLSRLKGVPLTKGQIIRVELRGNPVSFVVTNTAPIGTVIPNLDTEIVLREALTETVGVTYEDIGGLKREIGMIREMIELALRHPKFFARLGIEPPKSVLLYGPSGTGKTLILKAFSNDENFDDLLRFRVITPNHPSHPLVKFIVGNNEYIDCFRSVLKEEFSNASKEEPSVILIDDLDLIVAGRDQMVERSERELLATFLSLVDECRSIEKRVFILGATNRIDRLDESLKSRFDIKIEIGIPDKAARKEILEVHTRYVQLEEVNMEALANKTAGFVGAKIATLCRRAGSIAVKRYLSETEGMETSEENLNRLRLSQADFDEALEEMEGSNTASFGS